jgi:hypothetical protein
VRTAKRPNTSEISFSLYAPGGGSLCSSGGRDVLVGLAGEVSKKSFQGRANALPASHLKLSEATEDVLVGGGANKVSPIGKLRGE